MSTASDHSETQSGQASESAKRKRADLPPAAQRALAEAEDRRRLAEQSKEQATKEINGRKGPEPTRYGDWEKGGLAIDF